MLQAGVAKFDLKTEKFTMFPLPTDINNPAAQQAMVMPISSDVDGKVWMNNVGIPGVHRMDLATQKFETFAPFADFPKGQEHSVYGIKADSQNNLFFMDFSADLVGQIDAKTGKYTLLQDADAELEPAARLHRPAGPALVHRIPRRQARDVRHQDREVHRVGSCRRRTRWPYDVIPDKNGELWTAGMSNDRVTRLDPKTGQVDRISAAAEHQRAPRVGRQLDHAGDVLGRQQPRRLDRQGRAAGLMH